MTARPLNDHCTLQVSDKYPLTFSVLSGYGTASLIGGGTRLEASVRNVAGVVTLGDTPVFAFAGERPALQLAWHRCVIPNSSQDTDALRGVVFCGCSPHSSLPSRVLVSERTSAHLGCSGDAQHLFMLCCRSGIRLVAVQCGRVLAAPQSRDVSKAAALLRSSQKRPSGLPGNRESPRQLLRSHRRLNRVVSL